MHWTFFANFVLQGKVHGSLARAGKVKSQTPKVAKQEKKKPVVGRAKKRIIYKIKVLKRVEGHTIAPWLNMEESEGAIKTYFSMRSHKPADGVIASTLKVELLEK
ncbi:hypothetical protein NQZ79_g4731 [Umbelopsis isabellina]|nr:hypothetical protein NQZ79_g4731 [Umbelopsis isabellina]